MLRALLARGMRCLHPSVLTVKGGMGRRSGRIGGFFGSYGPISLSDNPRYWETIDALGNITNETERDALAMTLLGKSAQELNPLIEAGAERMSEPGVQAQAAGYVVSDKLLAAYGALDDQLQYLSVGATAAKNALGTVLLPVLKDLAEEGTVLLAEFTNGVLEADGDIGKITQVVGDVLPLALNKIMEYVPVMLTLVMEVIRSFGQAITDNLPMLVETSGQIVFTLLNGMIAALPQITEGALQLILTLVEGLIQNLPQVMEAAVQMVASLAMGIAQALPELIPSLVQAVVYICQTLVSNINLIIEAALALIANLPYIITEIVKAVPQIVNGIVNAFGNLMYKIVDIGKNIVTGVWQGIQNMASWFASQVSGFFSSMVDDVKKRSEFIPRQRCLQRSVCTWHKVLVRAFHLKWAGFLRIVRTAFPPMWTRPSTPTSAEPS